MMMTMTMTITVSTMTIMMAPGDRGLPDRTDVPNLLNLLHSLPLDILLTGPRHFLYSGSHLLHPDR